MHNTISTEEYRISSTNSLSKKGPAKNEGVGGVRRRRLEPVLANEREEGSQVRHDFDMSLTRVRHEFDMSSTRVRHELDMSST